MTYALGYICPKPGDEGRRAAIHLVLWAVPGDAGGVGHVRVHQEHVTSFNYHTKALATEFEKFIAMPLKLSSKMQLQSKQSKKLPLFEDWLQAVVRDETVTTSCSFSHLFSSKINQ